MSLALSSCVNCKSHFVSQVLSFLVHDVRVGTKAGWQTELPGALSSEDHELPRAPATPALCALRTTLKGGLELGTP